MSHLQSADVNELPRRKRRGIKSFWEKRIAASREVSDPIWKNDAVSPSYEGGKSFMSLQPGGEG